MSHYKNSKTVGPTINNNCDKAVLSTSLGRVENIISKIECWSIEMQERIAKEVSLGVLVLTYMLSFLLFILQISSKNRYLVWNDSPGSYSYLAHMRKQKTNFYLPETYCSKETG